MAKYKASPFYNANGIRFDYQGEYETDKAKEIEVLDALCPVWIKRIDSPKPKAEEVTKEDEAKAEQPASKPSGSRKSSAK